MLNHALALARRGFKIFPVAAGEKTPLIKGWPSLATTDTKQIQSWWTQYPTANIGIHADGMILDVDPKKGGYESLSKLESEISLPETYEVSTPSGGKHLYFATAIPVRNGVDIFGPGLDVRAAAGYVLGPGSKTAKGGYRVHRDAPIAEAPAELVARARIRKNEPLRSAETSQATNEEAALTRAREWLQTHPAAKEGAGGDAHTYATICRIRDFGVPEPRAGEALAAWNARCAPPWELDALAAKIGNAYRYAQEPAGKLTPEGLGFEKIEQEKDSQKDSQNDAPPPSRLKHPADVQLGGVLKSSYLIKGILDQQSNAVLFGKWNTGKSFVALDMAASIATGTPWFDKRVKQAGVLYLAYEGLRAMEKRIIALRGKHLGLGQRDTAFEWVGLRKPLTVEAGLKVLGEVLTEFRARHGQEPGLVMIDPLVNALGGDDSDAQLLGVLNSCVAALIQKQKCAVLRVHHSGHGNQDRARGHSSLPAGADTEIRVSMADSGKGEIKLTKQRDDVRGMLQFQLKIVGLGQDGDGDSVTTCVVEPFVATAEDLAIGEREEHE